MLSKEAISNASIYCDYDSTINDMSYWVEWINKVFNTAYLPKDISHWEWFSDLEASTGFDVFGYFKENVAYSRESLATRPLPGAKQFFSDLCGVCNTFILTATHDTSIIEVKNDHIEDHFDFQSSMVIHDLSKHKFATTEGQPNILIDDKVANCIEWVENGGIAFLYNHNNTYPYAETEYCHKNLIKVSSYCEILSILMKAK